MDNYPPGAANDPNAPYNQTEEPEVDVEVTETLYKETTILSSGSHKVMDWDYNPDTGRSECTAFTEYSDLKDDFENQQRSAYKCLEDCCKVLNELIKEGKTFYANIYLPNLLEDCDDWEQEELEVEEE